MADGSVHAISQDMGNNAREYLGNRADLQMMGDWDRIEDDAESSELGLEGM